MQGLKSLANSHISAIFLFKILLTFWYNTSQYFSPRNFYGDTHALYQKQSRTNLQIYNSLHDFKSDTKINEWFNLAVYNESTLSQTAQELEFLPSLISPSSITSLRKTPTYLSPSPYLKNLLIQKSLPIIPLLPSSKRSCSGILKISIPTLKSRDF